MPRLGSESRSDSPAAQQIPAAHPRRLIGRRLVYLPRTTSTNDVAGELARAGEPEGTVVVADEQTAGRGRRGRVWVAPPRTAVLMSVILRPSLPPGRLPQLTIAASVAAAEAIERVAPVQCAIKWPNDLLVRERKVGGVLAEADIVGHQVVWCVVGIGINVSFRLSDVEPMRAPLSSEQDPSLAYLADSATSLLDECGRMLSREDLLLGVLSSLDRLYAEPREDGGAALWARWRARCTTLGRRVQVIPSYQGAASEPLVGRAEAVDTMGRLGLRLDSLDSGELRWLAYGEVSLRPADAT